VGKTRLAIALGTEPSWPATPFHFVTVQELVAQFQRARDANKLTERLTLLIKPKHLILDEMGYLAFDSFAAICMFQFVSERYEKGALILTSNESYGDWVTGELSTSPAESVRPAQLAPSTFAGNTT
jgi:DNA replication protein DnaC